MLTDINTFLSAVSLVLIFIDSYSHTKENVLRLYGSARINCVPKVTFKQYLLCSITFQKFELSRKYSLTINIEFNFNIPSNQEHIKLKWRKVRLFSIHNLYTLLKQTDTHIELLTTSNI